MITAAFWFAIGWIVSDLYHRLPTTRCPNPGCGELVRDKPLIGTLHLCSEQPEERLNPPAPPQRDHGAAAGEEKPPQTRQEDV